MSEETSQSATVPEDTKAAEETQATETPTDQQQGTETQPETGDDTHPLEPDGARFKQVWARAKHAEAERDSLREEIRKEREERIRFEERLNAKEEQQKATAQPEYTWAQLEQAIEEGKITRAWANEYREGLVAKKIREETRRELQQEQQAQTRETSVASEIARYKQLVPEVMQAGTAERAKVEREYAYMVQTLGFKPGVATELAATRAALGDLDTIERTVKAKQSTTREPFMETHSSTQKPPPKGKKLVDQLDARQKEHYEKMLRTGRYKDWDEIEAELKWTPPIRGRRG